MTHLRENKKIEMSAYTKDFRHSFISESVQKLSKEKTKKGITTKWATQYRKLQKQKYQIATQQSYISEIRKSLKAIYGKKTKQNETILKYILEVVKLSKHKKDILEKANTLQLQKRGDLKTERIKIKDFQKWLDNAENDLKTNKYIFDYMQLAIIVGVATGRRTEEIFRANFKKIDKNTLHFDGQAKKKGEDIPYNIPCLIDADLILKAIKRIRELKPLSTEKRVNTLVSSNLNKTIKKDTFKGYCDQYNILQMHDTRRIYACYCVNYLYQKTHGKERIYIKNILGHEFVATGECYEDFYIEL